MDFMTIAFSPGNVGAVTIGFTRDWAISVGVVGRIYDSSLVSVPRTPPGCPSIFG